MQHISGRQLLDSLRHHPPLLSSDGTFGICSAGAISDSGGDGAAANGVLDLPRVPFSDWELRPEDIEICRRPDGRQWEIGTGAFGQVSPGADRGWRMSACAVCFQGNIVWELHANIWATMHLPTL
jgi:hypothetical protein